MKVLIGYLKMVVVDRWSLFGGGRLTVLSNLLRRVLKSLTHLKYEVTVQIANQLFAADDLIIKANFKQYMQTFYNS